MASPANFVVLPVPPGRQSESAYVGRYRRYLMRRVEGELRIALREAIPDSEEPGRLGAVSFILSAAGAVS